MLKLPFLMYRFGKLSRINKVLKRMIPGNNKVNRGTGQICTKTLLHESKKKA